jgi:hypothetical protein
MYQDIWGGPGISEVLGFAEGSLVGSSDMKKPIALPHRTQEWQNRRHVDENGFF